MPVRTLAAAVAATTLLALAAPAASADSETVSDRRGDTVDPGMSARGNPAPSRRADIVRTVGQHENRRVTLRITVAELGPGNTSVQGRIRTDETTYTLSAFRSNGVLEKAVIQDDVGDIDCQGFQVQFQPQRDTIVLSAPRTCLSLPTFIRFGAWVNAWEDGVFRVDDARRNGDGNGPIRIGQRRLRHN